MKRSLCFSNVGCRIIGLCVSWFLGLGLNAPSEFELTMTPATPNQGHESKLLTSSQALDLYFGKHLRKDISKEWA